MIHPTAVIDAGAELGADVSIGAYSVVEAETRIGDGCVLGPRVTLLPYTTLGAGCRVHAGAVLGDVPQDTAFKACRSAVRIGPRCVIREGVTIHRGTRPDTVTAIGADCLLMAFSHCAHNVRLGDGVILANAALLGGYVEVGDRAFLSGSVSVHQFVKIGRLAMLGGNCAVSKDVPPFCMVRPVSLNTVQGLNVVGLRRAGFSAEDKQAVKRAYRLIFLAGLSPTDAAHRIRAELTAAPALEMAEFLDASTRGLCTPRRRPGAAHGDEEDACL
jgi:UDP-N-acetylglucosamine acyltransferase